MRDTCEYVVFTQSVAAEAFFLRGRLTLLSCLTAVQLFYPSACRSEVSESSKLSSGVGLEGVMDDVGVWGGCVTHIGVKHAHQQQQQRQQQQQLYFRPSRL